MLTVADALNPMVESLYVHNRDADRFMYLSMIGTESHISTIQALMKKLGFSLALQKNVFFFTCSYRLSKVATTALLLFSYLFCMIMYNLQCSYYVHIGQWRGIPILLLALFPLLNRIEILNIKANTI